MEALKLWTHEVFLAHETGPHPECKERLTAIERTLRRLQLDPYLATAPPDVEPLPLVSRVHEPDYVSKMRRLHVLRPTYLDPDTLVSPRSVEAALHACATVAQAVGDAAAGKVRAAFCLVRPPGHHAEAGRAMGFCLFNNVAVGVAYALSELKKARVAVVDWDVHHGNGTQNAFYRDPRVLFASIHQHPLYPGTGRLDETGEGLAEGTALNFPLEAGSSLADYQMVFEEVLIPRLERFDPELLLISAGYDAHDRDPLAGMRLSSEAYAKLAGYLYDFALRRDIGLVTVLEGGYHLDALALSVAYTIQGLGLSLDLTDPFTVPPLPVRSRTREVVAYHRRSSRG